MSAEQIHEQLTFSFEEKEKPARTKEYPRCGIWYYCKCGNLVGIKNEKGRMIYRPLNCDKCKTIVDWEGIEDGN